MRKFFSLIAAVLFAGSMMATEVTVSKTVEELATANSWANGTVVTPFALDEVITVSTDATDANTGKYYTSGQQVRLYQTGAAKLIVTAAEGYTISSITLTYASQNTGIFVEAESGVAVDFGNVQSATFTVGNSGEATNGQARVTAISVTYNGEGGVTPTPTMDYYVAGSMTDWAPVAAYKLAANPANEGEYMGEFTFAANDEFKVGYSDGTTIESTNYFPNGMDNNYVITEAGDYTVYFRPDGQGGADWHEGYINAVKKEIPQYEVAEAIAAGLTDDTEILVRGVITKMEFKGKNFAKYGSVNIYVADATGAEGAFEFYNCYSLNADTFRTSTPAYDAQSTAWVEFEEVADENGNAIHVGDTVIAFGKYKLYNETHELNTGCYLTEIKHPGDAPVEEDSVIYDWAGEIGTTIFGGNSNITTGTVKIHENTDDVNGIKFGSSYVYADGKYIAIKPTEGGFKAGDEISLSVVFNNTDATKYCMADVYAADQTTRLFRSDSASTLNGRNAGEPIVQTYTLEADQDSLFLGRYGNTGMFVTLLKVVREGGDVPPVEEHTYTVAGMESVFGTNWTPSDANNDMIKQEDGTYKWEKENLELAAGNVEFKVCKDHAWAEAYPAQNYNLAIEEAGIYTITITFNAETKEVAAVATKTGSAEIDPVVSIAGSMNSWNASANVMTLAEDKQTATLTLSLDANTYEFKVVLNGGEWRSNAQEFTRENASATDMTGNEANMHLVADVAGDYVFTWTFATNSLAITYPEAPVAADTIVIDIEQEVQYTDYVAQAGWWQFMAENDEYEISISNVSTTQAAGTYTIADLDADYTYLFRVADSTKIHFVEGSFELTEGEDGSRTIEGVVTGDDEKIYSIKLVFRIPTAETTVNVEIPEWGVVDAAQIYSYAGTLFYGEAADGTYIQFVVLGSNPLGTFTYDQLYANGTGIEVGGKFKPIYSMDVTVNASDAQRAIITMDILCYNNTLYHVTTLVGEGVDAIEAAQKAVKMIQNGQVVIIKNGVHYNVNGQVIK